MLTEDIHWISGMLSALALAKERRRAIVLKPLGQGCGDLDTW
jgi:hypothetical protein